VESCQGENFPSTFSFPQIFIWGKEGRKGTKFLSFWQIEMGRGAAGKKALWLLFAGEKTAA